MALQYRLPRSVQVDQLTAYGSAFEYKPLQDIPGFHPFIMPQCVQPAGGY